MDRIANLMCDALESKISELKQKNPNAKDEIAKYTAELYALLILLNTANGLNSVSEGINKLLRF